MKQVAVLEEEYMSFMKVIITFASDSNLMLVYKILSAINKFVFC